MLAQIGKKLWKTLGILAGLIFIIYFFWLIGFNVYRIYTSDDPYKLEYEGEIVDKTVTFEHWMEGSVQIRRLHVKLRDGKILKVSVTTELYDRTEIGMRVKSEKGKPIELSRKENQ